MTPDRKEPKYKKRTCFIKMQNMINRVPWIIYSACPKVRKGIRRLIRYAGDTITDRPKSAAESIAVARDRVTAPAMYIHLSLILIFFIILNSQSFYLYGINKISNKIQSGSRGNSLGFIGADPQKIRIVAERVQRLYALPQIINIIVKKFPNITSEYDRRVKKHIYVNDSKRQIIKVMIPDVQRFLVVPL